MSAAAGKRDHVRDDRGGAGGETVEAFRYGLVLVSHQVAVTAHRERNIEVLDAFRDGDRLLSLVDQ